MLRVAKSQIAFRCLISSLRRSHSHYTPCWAPLLAVGFADAQPTLHVHATRRSSVLNIALFAHNHGASHNFSTSQLNFSLTHVPHSREKYRKTRTEIYS
jgi:hypothetical protein